MGCPFFFYGAFIALVINICRRCDNLFWLCVSLVSVLGYSTLACVQAVLLACAKII